MPYFRPPKPFLLCYSDIIFLYFYIKTYQTQNHEEELQDVSVGYSHHVPKYGVGHAHHSRHDDTNGHWDLQDHRQTCT